jgi:hypothetical protein
MFMTTLNLNNQQYNADKLTDAAKAQIIHLKSIELEIERLRMQQAIYQTAHAAYLRSLETEVTKSPEALIAPTDEVVISDTAAAS